MQREAAYVNDVAKLSDADLARATGAAQSTSRAWLNGSRSPTGERAERLIELSALVERLERLMEPTTSRSGCAGRSPPSTTRSRST